MISSSFPEVQDGARRSDADRFSRLLQDFYGGLLEQGVPEHLASLVRRLNGDGVDKAATRKLALVVEREDEPRRLAGLLLEETGLEVVECATGEAALAALQHRGADVAFIFADQHLAGPRDGFNLAKTAATLWPGIHMVLTTSGIVERPDGLPASVIMMGKPWQGLDLIIEAERALKLADQPRGRSVD
ncbi:MAG: response regulator receiver protein [Enterovirga sp.]|jgi:CheY-like chemotaxis protein|nr:response regulator receiver protein [Enterovirga sp.]